MATLTWAAVDDAAPGDPGAYAGLASDFNETAENARQARALLERFGAGLDASVWRGEAADAFRDEIGKLPPKLAKLADSHATAAAGMATYGRVLEDLRAQARRLGDQAQAAESERMAAEAARDTATATDPAAPTAAYDDAVDRARRRATTLGRELDHLRDRRKAAEAAAVRALDRAHDLGIKNKSFLQRAWDAVDAWVDDHADLLRGISNGLKWISAAAGLLSFIPILAPICGPIALATGGVALLMDAALAASGNGSWKMLAVDGVLMALPGAGRLVSRAVRTARGTTQSARIATGAQRKGMPQHVAKMMGKRIEKGNAYNVLRRRHYPVNELRLENGRWLDSYEPGQFIVSRKRTQLAARKLSTAKGYVREVPKKYSPGQVVSDTPVNRTRYPHLVGRKLQGEMVLEIPRQKAPIPQEVLDYADELDVIVRQRSDFGGFQVGPPVSEVGETRELVERGG